MRTLKKILIFLLIVTSFCLGAEPVRGRSSPEPAAQDNTSPDGTRLVVFEGFMRYG
jgi:hypothetical protein